MSMEHQILHLIIAQLLKKPKCVITSMSILCTLDFYEDSAYLLPKCPRSQGKHRKHRGATTFSKMTLSIMTLSIMALDT